MKALLSAIKRYANYCANLEATTLPKERDARDRKRKKSEWTRVEKAVGDALSQAYPQPTRRYEDFTDADVARIGKVFVDACEANHKTIKRDLDFPIRAVLKELFK